MNITSIGTVPVIPPFVLQIPLPQPCLEHHPGAIHVAVANELPCPHLYAPFVLDQAIVLGPEHRPHLGCS